MYTTPDLHKEYKYCRDNLLPVVSDPTDSEYDGIFYFIGQYDFDPSNRQAVDLVVDLSLSIATEDKSCKYIVERPIEKDGLIYKCPEQTHLAPPSVRARIDRRERAISNAAQIGVGYVPDPGRFKRYIEYAHIAKTDAELESIISKGTEGSNSRTNPLTTILLALLIVVVLGVLLARAIY